MSEEIKKTEKYYLLVGVNRSLFALPAENIEKILANQKIYPVSGLDKRIHGMINYQGQAVMVLSLTENDSNDHKEGYVAIMRDGRRIFGLIFDKPEEIISGSGLWSIHKKQQPIQAKVERVDLGLIAI